MNRTIDSYHLDWTDVECGECGAGPGQDCTSTFHGNGYVIADGHPNRHETASYHVLDIHVQDGHAVTECEECGWIADVN